MMAVEKVEKAYQTLLSDDRVNVWHISLFVALLYLWQRNKFHNPVPITRRKLMQLAHFCSIATYHKCISDLQQFGYIQYTPSYHPGLGSSVKITLP